MTWALVGRKYFGRRSAFCFSLEHVLAEAQTATVLGDARDHGGVGGEEDEEEGGSGGIDSTA